MKSLEIEVDLNDLGIAFRKTKADLYYSPRCCRQELLTYEKSLSKNLRRLKKKLERGEAPEITKEHWRLIPNGVFPTDDGSHFISSSPKSRWQNIVKDTRENMDYKEAHGTSKPLAEFRVMEALSVEFHVFSTYWLNRVGHLFDAPLGDYCYGNRLRRTQPEKHEKVGDLNPLSLGSNIHYLHQYKSWQDNGLRAIQKALEEDKKVVAITADVSSFYHKLDSRFMCDPDFLASLDIDLTGEGEILNDLFIKSIHEWADLTPIKGGLPVGLVSSSVIANIALVELDRIIQENIAPLYYGRYVDDIILVMENTSDISAPEEVWDWIIEKSENKLIRDTSSDQWSINFKQDYLEGSEILFNQDKNKTFLLDGSLGKGILATITKEIQQRTSEWRAVPDLPDNAEQLEANLLSAIQADGAGADSLRKTDTITIRRAAFAIQLRDVEAYSRYLKPNEWKGIRHSFLDTFIEHILVLPTFFSFFNYLTRVIRLAVWCGDFDKLTLILEELKNIQRTLESDCSCSIKATKQKLSDKTILTKLHEELNKRITESIETAFPPSLTEKQKKDWSKSSELILDYYLEADPKEFHTLAKQYLFFDLAYIPFKQYLHETKRKEAGSLSNWKHSEYTISYRSINPLLSNSIKKGVKALQESLGIDPEIFGGLYHALLFPTRPPSLQDLYLLVDTPFSSSERKVISKSLLALRGFDPHDALPIIQENKSPPELSIPYSFSNEDKIKIGVTSWETKDQSWVASVVKQPDPDRFRRLIRITKLINAVMQAEHKPRYLIFPELSIPPLWFLPLANKLLKKGIHLISGVEYIHNEDQNCVHNQAWVALSYDALGYQTMILYRQDKQRPALVEERALHNTGGKVLHPESPWQTPPIIKHGDFYFSLLICSEFTNISYRAPLTGMIDALFIPEWNKDTETFNALVESSAADIHAYIVQCNDRAYGDSRIRVPAKLRHERDMIRLKGGLEDYFVVGEVDIKGLRQFQSCHRSPEKPFKPVPDGFKIADYRKTLPNS